MDNLDEQTDDHPDDGHPYNLFSEDPEHELDEEDAYKILDKWDRSQRSIPLRPETPGFYTGRDRYYDTLWKLRAACGSAKNTLKIMQLWPLPTFARASLVPLPAVWADLATMNQVGGMRINRTRYSTLLNVLAEMHELLRISISAGVQDIADTLESLMTMFEGSEQRKLAIANAGKVHQKTLDRFGRSYNVGRRKTSSARVWIIPTRLGTVTAPTGADQFGGEGNTASAAEPPIPTTTVLVNNLPLHHYFPNSLERERVTYPLRVAGVLGKYNIFALARGGGHTGQSGAIAHGIANGLTTHDIQLYRVLKKAGLLRRDPRQVERKKTNRPSARSGYRWTKR
ncbi:SSU ribosomal protein S9P [Cylindrobasidium torrendii FP15055 ss-10]|uniref:SSU ribosomal protein S9P n=1 Tax=Cylindrobasidium torrendii FP15055 ss-10 TaxID=1314674 RepID=A0A0D7BVJ2_9AGAR|nr:SSU ribosomal protein S9P [Cylindrobasidium torrendii FP15055 ss-10]